MRLYKRGRIWWCNFYSADGERFQRTTRCTDKHAAEAVLRQFERDAADPAHAAARKATLNDALALLHERIRRDVDRGERSCETFGFYATKIGHLARVLGHSLKLARLEPGDVDHYIERRRSESASDHTIKKELVKLGQALKLAKRSGIWSGDVDRVMPIRFSPKYTPRKDALTLETLQELLPVLPPDRAALVAFIVATSARKSEAFGARRFDVVGDCERVTLRGTKTKLAARTIPIVLPWQKGLLRYALKHGAGSSGVLFTRWANVTRDLRVACRAAGIPPITLNGFRRTYSTWMLDRGVSASNVGATMGHSTSAMVERVYDARTVENIAKRIEADLERVAPKRASQPAAEVADECSKCVTDSSPTPQIPRTVWTREPAVCSEKVVRPVRFELTTFGFEGRRSIQLSYGRR